MNKTNNTNMSDCGTYSDGGYSVPIYGGISAHAIRSNPTLEVIPGYTVTYKSYHEVEQNVMSKVSGDAKQQIKEMLCNLINIKKMNNFTSGEWTCSVITAFRKVSDTNDNNSSNPNIRLFVNNMSQHYTQMTLFDGTVFHFTAKPGGIDCSNHTISENYIAKTICEYLKTTLDDPKSWDISVYDGDRVVAKKL